MSTATFRVRSQYRLPVQCTVVVSTADLQAAGTLWNLSLDGCRMAGPVCPRVGTELELLISLPGRRDAIVVPSAQVAWARGQECGLRWPTLPPMDQRRLQRVITGHMGGRMS